MIACLWNKICYFCDKGRAGTSFPELTRAAKLEKKEEL